MLPALEIDLGGKQPRGYQLAAVERARSAVAAGCRNLVIVGPTGSGKTVMACMLIKLAEEKGKRALVIAPRRELVTQLSTHLYDCDVEHGIIMANSRGGENHYASVQVGTKGTIGSRAVRAKSMIMAKFDLVIVDECHDATASEWLKIYEMLQKAGNPVFIGLTATPSKGNGASIGPFWKQLVPTATYGDLQDAGHLVKVTAYAPETPDMNGCGIAAGDWKNDEVDKRINRPKLVGDVVEHWKRYGGDRQTVLFACNVRHSMHCRDAFKRAGINAAHIDATTDLADREDILADYNAGEIQVITNCDILTYGWDSPQTGTIILAAPSRSIVKYRQRSGRALRPFPGKEDCIIIDHSGAIFMHGFPDEDMEWSLDAGSNVVKESLTKRSKPEKEPSQICCTNCTCIYSGRPDCPRCGHRGGKSGQKIAFQKGLLKEVSREKAKAGGADTPEEKIKHWHYCLAVSANKGLKASAAAGMYKGKFKVAPWEEGFLPNMPEGYEWKKLTADLYPQYVQRKK